MFLYFSVDKLIFFVTSIHTAWSMSLLSKPLLSINDKPEKTVADFIVAKGYLPNEKDLPKASIVKNVDNDATYLLSKLSDEDLIKILTDQPNKSEYNVKDLVKITMNSKYTGSKINPTLNLDVNPKSNSFPNANDLFENLKKKRFQTVSDRKEPSQSQITILEKNKQQPQAAFFRLENKEVDPFASPKGGDTPFSTLQKINNMFYSHPTEIVPTLKAEDDEDKKELLFDVLVAQLKTLCCKRNKPQKNKPKSEFKLKALLDGIMPQPIQAPDAFKVAVGTPQLAIPTENMFLILNDEVKGSSNDESDLIAVDPDSLGKNSTVMLLGPIATPLSDAQLKVVMMRISNELAKPEYVSLLQQISDGTLTNENIRLADSLVTGPQTRRYIKPHRCNHQSKLARIYGGPKWLICTGYLNLNTPSLYD